MAETNKSNETLEELVPLYYDFKTNAKLYKENAEKLNEQIKKLCDEQNVSKGEFGEFKFSIVKQNKSSFDEDILLECALKLPESVQAKIVKVKQFVDEEELEKAVFLGLVDPEAFKVAQIAKEVVTLRVTKK